MQITSICRVDKGKFIVLLYPTEKIGIRHVQLAEYLENSGRKQIEIDGVMMFLWLTVDIKKIIYDRYSAYLSAGKAINNWNHSRAVIFDVASIIICLLYLSVPDIRDTSRIFRIIYGRFCAAYVTFMPLQMMYALIPRTWAAEAFLSPNERNIKRLFKFMA